MSHPNPIPLGLAFCSEAGAEGDEGGELAERSITGLHLLLRWVFAPNSVCQVLDTYWFLSILSKLPSTFIGSSRTCTNLFYQAIDANTSRPSGVLRSQ